VQSLLPKEHTISIQKSGYYDYYKTVPVEEKTVTKLENVTLFKKILKFQLVQNEVDFFSVAPNNQDILIALHEKNSIILRYKNFNSATEPPKIFVPKPGKIVDIRWSENSNAALIKIQNASDIFYYLFNPAGQTPTTERLAYLDKNSQSILFNPRDSQEIFYQENQVIYSLKKGDVQTVVKDALSYAFLGNNILWLSANGALYESDVSGNLTSALSAENASKNQNENYEIIIDTGKIFLQEGKSLYFFDQSAKSFTNFNAPAGNFEILSSPDSKNLVLWNREKIYLYSFENQNYAELFSGREIINCRWLNNDYIIFTSGNNTIISEVDYRGNINTVTLPSHLDLGNGETLSISEPMMHYIQQSGKIYILSNNTLAVSEKLTP